MSKKLAYERYQWFHGRTMAGACTNAAPLAYDPSRRGYVYGDNGYELPPVWLKEGELVALCLAQRLSAVVPDRELKGAMARLQRKFVDLRSDGSLSVIGDICGKVSVKNVEYYRVREPVFHAVAWALFRSVPHRRGDDIEVEARMTAGQGEKRRPGGFTSRGRRFRNPQAMRSSGRRLRSGTVFCRP